MILEYPLLVMRSIDGFKSRCLHVITGQNYRNTHTRTGQHTFGGGGGRPSFARMNSVGRGGSSRNFPGSIFSGVAGFFPLTAVTDPKFVGFFR